MRLSQLVQQYKLDVSVKPPKIPYRETITRRSEGHCRHKKQTGGAGQFGEVYLKVEPLPRGAGFEFVDQVKGGVIPTVFIPAVEKGVRQALDHGVVAGYPVEDVRVTVYDGCSVGERGLLHPWGHGCGTCPACELRRRGYEAWVDAGRPELLP